MITKTYDFGWGPELLTKQLEAEILQLYLSPIRLDASRTVIINNTWYTDQVHHVVTTDFAMCRPDRIVLVAMIDAAIVAADRYAVFCDDIRQVGYYRGLDEIDYWALAVDRWFNTGDLDLAEVGIVDLPYMCLNRKPHWHRQQLYDAMVDARVVDCGVVSMGAREDGGSAQRQLDIDIAVCSKGLNPNPGTEQTGLVNDIMSLGHPGNWRRIFLNVVTETQFNIHKTYFVSEKIYKPIMGLRPFLVYSRDGAVPWLNDHGFEPYVADFRDITDLDLARPENMVPFLTTLCGKPAAYFQKRMLDLRDKIVYNRQQFDRYVHHINEKITQGITCLT